MPVFQSRIGDERRQNMLKNRPGEENLPIQKIKLTIPAGEKVVTEKPPFLNGPRNL
jgi:hypothetical protein